MCGYNPLNKCLFYSHPLLWNYQELKLLFFWALQLQMAARRQGKLQRIIIIFHAWMSLMTDAVCVSHEDSLPEWLMTSLETVGLQTRTVCQIVTACFHATKSAFHLDILTDSLTDSETGLKFAQIIIFFVLINLIKY